MEPEIQRCDWPVGHEDYLAYHDGEWGRPTVDEHRLFEKICLEGFQSGLSWLTILRKRDRFREVFCDFDFDRVANFTEVDVERLLGDKGIVRHRGKIEARSTTRSGQSNSRPRKAHSSTGSGRGQSRCPRDMTAKFPQRPIGPQH